MDEQALQRVREVLAGFVRGRTEDDPEDVVQEAMTRLLENRSRVDPSGWTGYAVVTATNLLRERERVTAVHERHAHRLHVPDVADAPEQQLVTAEEHEALRRALDSLPPQEADLLVQHHGPTRSSRSIAPALAARLSRARARLRVAYVLEHTGVPLPTRRCRPVLEALSSGDRRRQERLGAGRHLLSCPGCAAYVPALVERRRALAGLNPLVWIGAGGAAAWAALRRRPGRATATSGTVLAAAVAASFALTPGSDPPPPAPPAPPAPQAVAAAGTVVVEGGGSLLPRSGASSPLGPASADQVPVQDVPADEGFWVGTEPGQRLWVELVADGESPVSITVGDRVSFQGQALRPPPGYPERVGLRPERGSAELVDMAVYVQVSAEDVLVLPGR